MHGGVSVILYQLKRVWTADWKWQTWGILPMLYISGTIVFWHAGVGLVKMSDSCERNNSGNQWHAPQKKKTGKITIMPALIFSHLLSSQSLQNNVCVCFFYMSSRCYILPIGSQLTKHQSSGRLRLFILGQQAASRHQVYEGCVTFRLFNVNKILKETLLDELLQSLKVKLNMALRGLGLATLFLPLCAF